jgi:methylmalonyl-CoA/ethylmalonyl-CoA epimerase
MFDFHHFGLACTDISLMAQEYMRFGYRTEGQEFIDETQQIRGLFIVGGGPRLELLQAHHNSTVLAPWLSSGPRIYHQAFQVDDIDDAMREFTSAKARILVEPVPAIAFGGRRICFVMTRALSLVELISNQ